MFQESKAPDLAGIRGKDKIGLYAEVIYTLSGFVKTSQELFSPIAAYVGHPKAHGITSWLNSEVKNG